MTLLQSDIVIDASSELVWQVLIDFESYQEWNPVEIDAKALPRLAPYWSTPPSSRAASR